MSEFSVVIPVREPKSAKSRLAGILSDDERSRLSLALLRRVLGAVESSAARYCVVVSSSPASISQTTGKFSKVVLVQERKFHGGVNSAIQDGIAALSLNPKVTSSSQARSSVMFIPSDLPFLDKGSIEEAARLLENFDAVISPSRRRDGTTLLGFHTVEEKLARKFQFHYDDDSFNKHIRELRNLRLNYSILESDKFSFDIDNLEDLELARKIVGAKSYSDFISVLLNGF